MKKIATAFLLLLCVACTANAQEMYVDSLKDTNQRNLPDSAKADLYNRIFFHYIFFQSDSAYHYAQLAFTTSSKANHKKGIAMYYNNVGILNRVEGDYPEAVQNILQSLKINEEIKNELGIGNNYVNIGLIYADEHKYALALSYYEKGLAIKMKHKDLTGIGYCYRDMGDVYVASGRYEKAIECYEKVVNIVNRPGLIYKALMSIGIVYYKLGDIANAKIKITASLVNLEKHDVFELAAAYNALGDIELAYKEYPKALTAYEKALLYAKKYKNNKGLKNAYQNLARCYKEMQRTDSAYTYLQHYTEIQDSLFNIESTEKMIRLQNNFSLRKKQTEIEHITKEKDLKAILMDRQKSFTYGVLVLAVLAVLLLMVFYNNDRKTRKINKILHIQKNELSEKNEEINQQKEEILAFNETLEYKIKERTNELDTVINELHQKNKDLADFSYIVAHNIRAPVASIQGLMSLIDYTKVTEPTHVEVLVHIQRTIESFEVVVNDLDAILEIRNIQQHTLEEVNLKAVTDALLAKLKKEIRRHKAIITIDFSKAMTLHTNKSYLTDIILHLLSNAIKYQSTNRALVIHLATYLNEKDVVLSVQDNGLGIDLSRTEVYKIFGMHQRMHTHVEGKGFGLYLVKNLIEALHGKITVESEVDEGTCFKVYFPQS